MKEHPILMASEPVRNILAGRQTQDRRPVKPQVAILTPAMAHGFGLPIPESSKPVIHCPYGEPGDRLWVRETWAVSSIYDGIAPRNIHTGAGVRYAATDERIGIKDRPSIHMPRWASRITLEITGVRVERLQEISPADAVAEGAAEILNRPLSDPLREAAYARGEWIADDESDPDVGNWYAGAVDAFAALWESCYGSGSWDNNPWVWVVEFRRIQP